MDMKRRSIDQMDKKRIKYIVAALMFYGFLPIELILQIFESVDGGYVKYSVLSAVL
jgi:hypothetical protein